MAGSGDRLDHRVAELDLLAVRKRLVRELGAGSLRHVGGRAGPLDQLRQARDVVRLDMRLDHGGDL